MPCRGKGSRKRVGVDRRPWAQAEFVGDEALCAGISLWGWFDLLKAKGLVSELRGIAARFSWPKGHPLKRASDRELRTMGAVVLVPVVLRGLQVQGSFAFPRLQPSGSEATRKIPQPQVAY